MTAHPLDLFEDAWTGTTIPDLAEYAALLHSRGAADQICELCQIDLERRWRLRSPECPPCSAEDYHSRFGHDFSRSQMIELICSEFRLRNRWGDFPGKELFLRRWSSELPDLGDALLRIESALKRPLVTLTGPGVSLQPFVLQGVLRIGRQLPGEPPPCALISGDEGTRLIVAGSEDPSLSRQQLEIRRESESVVRLGNSSRRRAIAVIGQQAIDGGQSLLCNLPVRVHLHGDLFVTIGWT
jgi:hypothetical protein